MKYTVKNTIVLKKLLWLDFTLGFITAFIGLLFFRSLAIFLGLTNNLLFIISIFNLIYSCVAFTLTQQKNTSLPLLRTLIYANWFWTGISTALLFFHFKDANIFGQLFLVLQIIVVGTVAYLEGNQLTRIN